MSLTGVAISMLGRNIQPDWIIPGLINDRAAADISMPPEFPSLHEIQSTQNSALFNFLVWSEKGGGPT